MFQCDNCGICCRHVDRDEHYKSLDRGDGICRYLQGNLCSIYENRPLWCRIDDCYEMFFSETISREEYYELNYNACKKLKMLEKE